MFFVFVGRLMEYLKGKLGYKIALGSAYGSGKNGGRRWCKEEKDKNYKVGDFIIHKMYGEGIIVSLEGTIGKICFTARSEIKTFDITHPSITKK